MPPRPSARRASCSRCSSTSSVTGVNSGCRRVSRCETQNAAAARRESHATLPAGSSLRIDRALAATCDHLLWGAADLEVAIAALAERTAVRATAGGRHPDLGTHNAIVALGRKRFLEVIAPDPTLRPGALARRLAGMKTPSLTI